MDSTHQHQDTRTRILMEAERLFRHYGYGKTTIADISQACGMSAANVYRCVSVLAGHLDEQDWRIIRVDRPINAPQVTMRTEGRPPLGAPLTVVGHPSGLPVTISDGAAVQRHKQTFFSADLDTYQGNSGSPVFNTDRLRAGELFVEGILVRGENDLMNL